MELDKLIDDCSAIEHTVSVLTKSNAKKQVELEALQESVLESTKQRLDQLVDREEEIRKDLECLRSKRQDVEVEVKSLSSINEKLTKLVASLQENTGDDSMQVDQSQLNMASSIQDYEQLKADFKHISENYKTLIGESDINDSEVKELRQKQVSLACSIFLNYNYLRILTNVNGYAEEQFDLILSELPWEPLSSSYIEDLRRSNNERIRNLAETLVIQTSEISDLVDSLDQRKSRKLKVLDELCKELDDLLRNREQAMLMCSKSNRDGRPGLA